MTFFSISQSIAKPAVPPQPAGCFFVLASWQVRQVCIQRLDRITVVAVPGHEVRLAHPGVHLLVLIVVFNIGINWAVRRATAASEAVAAGAAPTAALPWRRYAAIALAIGLAGALYLAIRPGPPEPTPAEPTEPVPAEAWILGEVESKSAV